MLLTLAMSWFSDLTDKAGALLNKVDQVAAASLQEVGISSPSPSKNTNQLVSSSTGHEPVISPSYWDNQRERGVTVAQVLVGNASDSPLISTSRHYKPATCPTPTVSGHTHSHFDSTHYLPRSSNSSTPNQSVTEDSLLEFLNSPKPKVSIGSSSSKQISAIMTPVQTEVKIPRHHSSPMLTEAPLKEAEPKEPRMNKSAEPDLEQESKVTMAVLVAERTEEEEKRTKGDEGEQAGMVEEIDFHDIDDHSLPNPPMESECEHQDEAPVYKEVDASSSAAAELEKWKQIVSSLELENKLMKREVASLNEELGGVMTHLNEASQNAVQYQSEIRSLREQALRSDHMIRQLRSHNEDLQAAMEAQGSQLQVLRTQLALADKAVEENKEQYVLAKKEQER